MTQAIENTKINHFEEMLSNKQKVCESVANGMDKTTSDFKNVFDKTLDKARVKIDNNEINLDKKLDFSEIKAAIKDLKNTNTEEMDIVENWSEFKDLLTEITSEANVETSLDLTLAKDINEIITQLKEAVEKTDEIIEDSLDVEIAAKDSTLLNSELLNASDNKEEENINVNENLNQENANLIHKSDISFEQLITSLNTALSNFSKEDNIEKETLSIKEEVTDLSLEVQQMDSEEVINLAENLIEEVVSTKTTEYTSEKSEELIIDEEILKDLNIESIEAEVDTSTDGNLMQNQSPEEYAVKAMINQEVETFDLKIDSTHQVQQTTSQAQAAKTIDINPSRIIEQISKNLEALKNNSKVSMVLNPESLGKVDIQLLNTKDGLSAQFTVATQEARELLMKGLEGLKETLTSHGVGVDNVSVKVAEGQKSEYKQDWTEQDSSQGGNKKQDQPNREEKEKEKFEKIMAQNNKNENENENGNV